MTLNELRDAIEAMEAARSAVFTVGLRIDDSTMARSSGYYITDLNWTLESCKRALAQRLADGEEYEKEEICGDTLEVSPGENVMCHKPAGHSGAHQERGRMWN